MIIPSNKFTLAALIRDDGKRLDLTGSEIRLSS